jgi:hypothetical protein
MEILGMKKLKNQIKNSMESISSRLDVRKKECKGLKTRLRNYFILIAIKEK